MMLRRIDKDVPKGTNIAILQPGGNDLPFFALGNSVPPTFPK